MTTIVGIVSVMLLGIPAMVLHECGHIGTALLCGVKVKKVGLSRRGLYTVREAGPKWSNIIVSAAGPMVNLLLAIVLWNTMNLFAEVNLVACIYNLLPIPNSDGTRILALLTNTSAVPQPVTQVGAQM